MIGIIDYGMGNILSVKNAVEMLGDDAILCREPQELKDTTKLILPGVGAFGDCIRNLTTKGFTEALHTEVLVNKKPILGICLGMQVMAKRSFEGGVHAGLGWFDAEVVRLGSKNPALRVPHVGWNSVTFREGHFLAAGLPPSPDLYFVHSYFMSCRTQEDVVATCEYGEPVTAAVQKENIVATQFHPEKSQDYGLKILLNFLRMNSTYVKKTADPKITA